ncbi:hypothetical protein ACFQ6U_23815 [Streptomyces sp. NPDC056465]|uniref:hypothetical protein n=1 Tax=unclassified Streptomyces TaxID=2593676 RepID=UPI0035DD7872
MRVPRPVVIGWFLLVAGGWAATLWLGEPSATAGPGPAPAVGNPVPGPQPAGSCASPGAAASASPSADPALTVKLPDGYRDGLAVQVYCSSVTVTAR